MWRIDRRENNVDGDVSMRKTLVDQAFELVQWCSCHMLFVGVCSVAFGVSSLIYFWVATLLEVFMTF